ncbi:MAG TPA: hypothetical protein VMH86_06280 [Rhizomicrobium sp.]|nr:hypothetical protein [Rhizomicrobium sp.]
MKFVRDLDTPLLRLSARDNFTLRDACQGVHVFGGIGSGKTSGSGKAIASAYLRAGMGGLVLCAKPEEVEQWQRYAAQNGRANSLVLFGEHGGGFNFITYELARQGASGSGSVVECLMRVLEASRLSNPSGGGSEQHFWQDAMRQLLRNTIPILYAATGTVRIPEIIRFVASAPTSLQQLRDPDWQELSFMFATLATAKRKPTYPLPEEDFDKIASYWRDEFAQLDPKTRSNISISLSTALDRFNHGRLQKAFCTSTTLVPELTFHGVVIVMDMSALTWNEDGIIGQQLFKYMWQRAALSRNKLEPKHRERPVFLWADESQYFVNSYDTDFQSTCRGSLACTVYLTQSLPTYHAKMGGDQPVSKANTLLASFITKVFHNNADPETNKWAADTIGRIIQRRGTYSRGTSTSRSYGMSEGASTNMGTSSSVGWSRDAQGNTSINSSFGSSSGTGENTGRNRGLTRGESYSGGYSETMDYEVEPADFARALKTGGPANGNNVTAIWFQAGKTFNDSGRNYLLTRFEQ